MNILYVSSVCSDKKFQQLFIDSIIKPHQQGQKFNKLLSEGLLKSNTDFQFLTAISINKKIIKKKWLSAQKEFDDRILYTYIPFINFPVIKHLMIFIWGFIFCIKWSIQNRNKENVVICDTLNLTNSISAFLASKICRFKKIAIVTDIPDYLDNFTSSKKGVINILTNLFYKSLCKYFMTRYDSYIILTEQMNHIVNPNNHNYIVIEGMVNIDMKNICNKLEEKYDNKILIYAGALQEKYGIKKLLDSFLKLDLDDVKLWIFGSGELESEIKKYELKDMRIKYFGVVQNSIIVEEELKATLLVNPRPSSEEFTKYSFPSKNMEYMASGTPILTTKLSGMPSEYDDFVYFIENETIEGLTDSLKKILSKSREELHEKGKKAKEFVMNEKNNVIQAEKIIKLIRKLFDDNK